MPKITISLPDAYVDMLDLVADRARCSQAEIIRQAIQLHIEDLSLCAERLYDSSDLVLPWEKIKDGLSD